MPEGSRGWSIRRRRLFLFACFAAGLALMVLGIWRWPPDFGGSFVADPSHKVGLGIADYCLALLVLVAGPTFWLRRARKENRLDPKHLGWDGAWSLSLFVGSIILAVLAGLFLIGMLRAVGGRIW